jgi:hypothetical protein
LISIESTPEAPRALADAGSRLSEGVQREVGAVGAVTLLDEDDPQPDDSETAATTRSNDRK